MINPCGDIEAGDFIETKFYPLEAEPIQVNYQPWTFPDVPLCGQKLFTISSEDYGSEIFTVEDDTSTVLIDVSEINPGVSIDFILKGKFDSQSTGQAKEASVELYVLEFEVIENLNYTIGEDLEEIQVFYTLLPNDEVQHSFSAKLADGSNLPDCILFDDKKLLF